MRIERKHKNRLKRKELLIEDASLEGEKKGPTSVADVQNSLMQTTSEPYQILIIVGSLRLIAILVWNTLALVPCLKANNNRDNNNNNWI